MGDLATRAAGELFDPQAELLVNDGRVGAVGSGEFAAIIAFANAIGK